MVQHFPRTQRPAPRRPVHPPRLRDRRPIEWVLSFAYAALLTAAIWRLDYGDLGEDMTPAPTVSAAEARAQSLIYGFTESLRFGRRDPAPLSRQQSQPEGWPLWTGRPDERSPAAEPHDPKPSAGRPSN